MNNTPASFDALFSGDDDPWQFRTRWYEERKRLMTLAALPARRYRRGYEPGCANGELAAALAGRCERLLVSDGSPRAVALARQRLAGLANVEVSEAWVPDEWPVGRFDLIVFSELGYFLSGDALDRLIRRMEASLSPDGTLLACHWCHPIADGELDGDEVHRRLRAQLSLPLVGETRDADFRIDVWCADGRSVAEREGFA